MICLCFFCKTWVIYVFPNRLPSPVSTTKLSIKENLNLLKVVLISEVLNLQLGCHSFITNMHDCGRQIVKKYSSKFTELLFN